MAHCVDYFEESRDVDYPQLLTYTIRLLGDVAQLGEHRLCKPGVGGSSPPISRKENESTFNWLIKSFPG